jgi:hypothetical protein
MFVYFACFMCMIKIRYECINAMMRKYYFKKGFVIASEIAKGQHLSQLSMLHDKLVDVSHYTSQCFGVPIMLHMMPIFVFILLALFSTIVRLLRKDEISLLIFSVQSYYFILLSSLLFGTFIFGHFTAREVSVN